MEETLFLVGPHFFLWKTLAIFFLSRETNQNFLEQQIISHFKFHFKNANHFFNYFGITSICSAQRVSNVLILLISFLAKNVCFWQKHFKFFCQQLHFLDFQLQLQLRSLNLCLFIFFNDVNFLFYCLNCNRYKCI